MSDTPLPPPPPQFPALPPGYVAYGGHGAAPQRTEPIGGISKAIVILLGITIPLQIISVFATLTTISKARDYLRGGSESSFKNASQLNIGSFSGLLIIPIAVLTMIWMYRMAGNLRALGRTNATWAPGWAIGGWFTPPCVIYAVPWLMFRELWKGSDPEVGLHDPAWKSGKVSPLINVWWVLYGLLPLVGFATSANVISQLRKGSTTTETLAKQFDRYATLNTVLTVVAIGTTVVYLVLVRQLSARHMKATREA